METTQPSTVIVVCRATNDGAPPPPLDCLIRECMHCKTSTYLSKITLLQALKHELPVQCVCISCARRARRPTLIDPPSQAACEEHERRSGEKVTPEELLGRMMRNVYGD